jgi:hypothetical protein
MPVAGRKGKWSGLSATGIEVPAGNRDLAGRIPSFVAVSRGRAAIVRTLGRAGSPGRWGNTQQIASYSGTDSSHCRAR